VNRITYSDFVSRDCERNALEHPATDGKDSPSVTIRQLIRPTEEQRCAIGMRGFLAISFMVTTGHALDVLPHAKRRLRCRTAKASLQIGNVALWRHRLDGAQIDARAGLC